jgi:hypothetical protein
MHHCAAGHAHKRGGYAGVPAAAGHASSKAYEHRRIILANPE